MLLAPTISLDVVVVVDEDIKDTVALLARQGYLLLVRLDLDGDPDENVCRVMLHTLILGIMCAE